MFNIYYVKSNATYGASPRTQQNFGVPRYPFQQSTLMYPASQLPFAPRSTLVQNDLFQFNFTVKGISLGYEELKELHVQLLEGHFKRASNVHFQSVVSSKLFVGDKELTAAEQESLLVTLEPLFPAIVHQSPTAFMFPNGPARS